MFLLIFYFSLTILHVFLFRRDISFLLQNIAKIKTGSIWLVLFSLLVFVDLLPIQSLSSNVSYITTNFRIINFIFYCGGIWIGYKVWQLGLRQTIYILTKGPIAYFNCFGVVCLVSACFAIQIPHFPVDWNIQHALRILIFFLSVSLLTDDSNQPYILNLRVLYVLLTILLLRVLLPFFEALLSDKLMFWEWIQLQRNSEWYLWSFASGWGWYGFYTKDDNGLGMMANSYSFVVSVFFLVFLNHFYYKKSFDWRFVLPIIFSFIIIYQFPSQTTLLIVFFGILLILISKVKWLTLIPIIIFGLILWYFKDVANLIPIFELSLQQIFDTDYRLSVIFPAAFKGFLERPWMGYGYLSGEYIYFQNHALPPHIVESHNTVLSIALNTGILGLVSFCLGIYFISRVLLRFWMKSGFDIFSTNLILLFASSCVASLFLTDVFYMFDDQLLIRMYPFFIVLLISQMIYNFNLQDAK